MYKKSKISSKVIIAIVIILVVAVVGIFTAMAFNSSGKVKEQDAADTEDVFETEDIVDQEEVAVEPAASEATEKSDATTTTTATTTPTTSAKTGNENLPITQWGVTGYYKGLRAVDYDVTASSSVLFDSSDITCPGTRISSLRRYLGTDEIYSNVGEDVLGIASVLYATDKLNGVGDLNKKVGDYYYVFTGPLQQCADSSQTEIQQQIYSDLKEYFASLVLI